MPSREDAVGFVRDTLGCGCPAELLARIEIGGEPRALAGVPLRMAMNVGGRLLVCVADESPGLEERLGQILEEGRRLRDAGGFNRFRFVVAAEESAEARARLSKRVDRLSGLDDRLHVHVVAPSELPAGLRRRD